MVPCISIQHIGESEIVNADRALNVCVSFFIGVFNHSTFITVKSSIVIRFCDFGVQHDFCSLLMPSLLLYYY